MGILLPTWREKTDTIHINHPSSLIIIFVTFIFSVWKLIECAHIELIAQDSSNSTKTTTKLWSFLKTTNINKNSTLQSNTKTTDPWLSEIKRHVQKKILRPWHSKHLQHLTNTEEVGLLLTSARTCDLFVTNSNVHPNRLYSFANHSRSDNFSWTSNSALLSASLKLK